MLRRSRTQTAPEEPVNGAHTEFNGAYSEFGFARQR
jgi:hypothetical protein